MLLLDPIAWILSGLGGMLQWVASKISSNYFKPLNASHLSEEFRVQELLRVLSEVNMQSLKVLNEPMPLTLVAARRTHSIYCGETCLVTGTIEECDKFVCGLLFMLLRKGL